MKVTLISLCIGFGLLGTGACGKSGTAPSLPSATDAGSGGMLGGAEAGASGGSGLTGTVGHAGVGATPEGGSSGMTAAEAGSSGMTAAEAGAPSTTDPHQCAPGNTTTISGVVYDPAGKNPLDNVQVYVPDPSSPLPDLDSVPLGCDCAQLLPAKVLASGAPTDESGHFEIPCAPSGTLSLVVQTGKWRRQYDGVKVLANKQNVVPGLRLPANSSEGSLPNIAISTGGGDSFECLPLRLGVSASEYVAGSASGGHIHIYTGLRGATPAQGAVQSFETLWDSQAHLNEHDVVVLSCESEETKGGNPGLPLDPTTQQYLMNYANAGGRVFATHNQYAWFNTGPFAFGPNNLATWNVGQAAVDNSQAFPAEVDTTLADGAAFAKGAALAKWLKLIGALTNDQLPVWFAHSNVNTLAPRSTEWIHLSASSPLAPSAPQLFSVDMPLDASGSAVCGRIVYSTLHGSGGPNTNAPGVPVDYPLSGGGSDPGGFPPGQARGGTVPAGCAMHPVTPQEAAFEFMFFDLSSCLTPIQQ